MGTRGLLTTTRRSECVLYIDEFSDLSIGRTFSTSTRAVPDGWRWIVDAYLEGHRYIVGTGGRVVAAVCTLGRVVVAGRIAVEGLKAPGMKGIFLYSSLLVFSDGSFGSRQSKRFVLGFW